MVTGVEEGGVSRREEHGGSTIGGGLLSPSRQVSACSRKFGLEGMNLRSSNLGVDLVLKGSVREEPFDGHV